MFGSTKQTNIVQILDTLDENQFKYQLFMVIALNIKYLWATLVLKRDIMIKSVLHISSK